MISLIFKPIFQRYEFALQWLFDLLSFDAVSQDSWIFCSHTFELILTLQSKLQHYLKSTILKVN